MLEHTKKHHTKNVTITFIGPEKGKDKAIKAMRSLGFEDTTGSIPWREAFAEFKDNEQGTALIGARHKEGLTQRKLAELAGIPQRHISEMENGKRPIGKKNAKALSKILDIDYRLLM
ncbi:MAG: helix-turn-helix transcriptional regulator [Pseudomonadota bacterium]